MNIELKNNIKVEEYNNLREQVGGIKQIKKELESRGNKSERGNK